MGVPGAHTCKALTSCGSSWVVRNKGVMPASDSFSTASRSCGVARAGLLLKKTATLRIRNPPRTRLYVFRATNDMAVSRLCCLDVRATCRFLILSRSTDFFLDSAKRISVVTSLL